MLRSQVAVRSVVPKFMRERNADRLLGPRGDSFCALPSTPAIDPRIACGVSLVELARMAQEVAS